MKGIAALIVALLLTILASVPAVAAKPMAEFRDLPFDFSESWDGLCPFDVTYRSAGKESLTLWYPKGADSEVDPWIKGRYQRKGTDSFAANGNIVSGDFRFTSHLSDLVLGDPPSVPNTWKETTSGLYWGIQIPGAGTVFHESGNFRQRAEARFEDPETWEYIQLRDPRGSAVFDVDALCRALAD